ncbi:MAG: DNA-directed RNA polymerase subunit beta' [Armatimonadetes bacterium]|nr:DNA-directed RNA polymerase subunit beta' [Armatimonadota bacterium]
MAHKNLFDKIRIGIASPQEIRSWSHGEAKKPETINYRTFKPERDGLFCERIFGPVKDWECACGRYKKIKYKGIVCERCGVEVTRSKVRRERMGHVELAAPVCHIWYLKGVPSPLSLILDISPKQLEKVIYFAAFIIIDLEEEKIKELIPKIYQGVEQEKLGIQEQMKQLEVESLKRLATEMVNNPDEYFDEGYVRERMKANFDRIRAEFRDADERLHDLDIAAKLVGELEVNMLIDEDKWRAISKMLDAVGRRLQIDLDELVTASIGAEAMRLLLRRVDMEQLAVDLKIEVVEATSQRRVRAIKRLEIVKALLKSKSRPDWMILDVVPVISPELRPMVQLDGGRFATSDLNDLYRRIINRNNRLKKIIEIQAPESIINHEKRLLQEAVDGLIDNGRRSRPVVGSNQRPLKSLSDMLKGKEGRFRKNLLGKRVDYSGRSVIVVGPHLKLHQCGLPKEMALELFKPFVMKTLVERKITQNIKTAKRMIERMHPAVWDGLEDVIREHPVLLNRAPTLHRLGIQAFEPILVEGKAIQLHPLVCHAFNADFDGDQMAVHVPLSMQAQSEARVLMLSTQNLFSPADGRPVASPIQDIVLGSYALTFTNIEAAKALDKQIELNESDPEEHAPPPIFSSPDEVLHTFENPRGTTLNVNAPVRVRIRRPVFRPDDEIDHRDPETGGEFVEEITTNEFDEEVRELKPLERKYESLVVTTTPGRLEFNGVLPYPLRYSDEFLHLELTKKALATTIVACHDQVGTEGTIKLLDDIKDIGFKWATQYGLSIAMTDMDPPDRRVEVLDEADVKADRILQQYRTGRTTFREMQENLIRLWTDTYDEIGNAIVDNMSQDNPLSIITVSGARGSVKQIAQLSGMRGLMFNQFNEVIYELPVRSSFQIGLSMLEFFVTTHGARKGLADTALRTADAGYLTRRLVDVAQDVIIRAKDCGTLEGSIATKLMFEGKVIENIGDRTFGRVVTKSVKNLKGKLVVASGGVVTVDMVSVLNGVEEGYVVLAAEVESDEDLTKLHKKFRRLGYDFDDHGRLGLVVRSPLTCRLEQGICAMCYGVDLASQKIVEQGVAVGIIAAQSIGEPGTQLTMRTFHTGGVAGSKSIARTSQYKTGKFIRQFQEDFQAATQTDSKEFDPTKLIESQSSAVKSLFTRGALVEEAGAKPRKTKATEKAKEKADTESRRMWERSRKTFFYSWTGESSGIVRVEEIFEARKQPRGKAIICPVTGVIADVQRSSYGRWVIVEAEVPTNQTMKEAYVADTQNWETQLSTVPSVSGKKKEKTIETYDSALERVIGQKINTATLQVLRRHKCKTVRVFYPILVPPLGNLPIEKGANIIKGDPLTEGPLDPHEVLELAGAKSVYDYFIENLQSVYKDQGVDINDKHLEVIIRQMLRKRKITEAGDTPFLPGQIVDRFRFARENKKLKQMIAAEEKVQIVDPVTGGTKERKPKLATCSWVLLGITEASLATDSFLSAASFQKTTRVLTDAAVRGKHDELRGLKENVIIGRLIPAGTGVMEYRDLAVDVDRTQPSWAHQSLSALVESGEEDVESLEDAFGGLSLADLATEEAKESGR